MYAARCGGWLLADELLPRVWVRMGPVPCREPILQYMQFDYHFILGGDYNELPLANVKISGKGPLSTNEIGYPTGDNLGVDLHHNSSLVMAGLPWQKAGSVATAGIR